MEQTVWMEKLKTGISEIDRQHIEFIHDCNKVALCASNTCGFTTAKKSIDILAKQAAKHFETEEKYMGASLYPDKEGHKKLHKHFMVQLGEIEKMARKGITGPVFSAEIGEKLTHWFILHIKKTDKVMASYITKKSR